METVTYNTLLAYGPSLLWATITTLQIAFLSSTIGFFLGTILGFAQQYAPAYIQWLILPYVTILRGTPMLIQISFWYFVLPMIGIKLSLFAVAVISIGLNSSAYISQIIKSGINSVDKGQQEAGRVLGLNNYQIMRYIIFPQAVRVVIPSLLNEFITLIKDSSLASTIGVVELFKQGRIIIDNTYLVIPVYCVIAAIYLILTTTLSLISAHIERKMNYHVRD